MDYSKLEGKPVKVFYGNKAYRGKVSVFDKDIGLTIQDGDHYLLCWNNHKSPLVTKGKMVQEFTKKGARKMNKFFAKCILKGEIDCVELVKESRKWLKRGIIVKSFEERQGASKYTCAFS